MPGAARARRPPGRAWRVPGLRRCSACKVRPRLALRVSGGRRSVGARWLRGLWRSVDRLNGDVRLRSPVLQRSRRQVMKLIPRAEPEFLSVRARVRPPRWTIARHRVPPGRDPTRSAACRACCSCTARRRAPGCIRLRGRRGTAAGHDPQCRGLRGNRRKAAGPGLIQDA